MSQSEEYEEQSRLFEDYEDDNLSINDREEFEQRLEEDEEFLRDYRTFQNTQAVLASMGKHEKHSGFGERVSAEIHNRSGGRFFGRRGFGDKIPFELLTIVVLVLAFLLTMVLRNSDFGYLDFSTESDEAKSEHVDQNIGPKP